MSSDPVVSLKEAVAHLNGGGVVAYPTETFFGLAALPDNAVAVEKLIALKSRLDGAGVSLIIDSDQYVERIVAREERAVRDARVALQNRFWPGPLTLVVSASVAAQQRLAPQLFALDRTLALRVSSNPVARSLALAIRGAVTATSANPKGLPPAESVDQVQAYFPGLPVYLGEEDANIGERAILPSTIIDATALPFSVLRLGAIPVSELAQIVPIA